MRVLRLLFATLQHVTSLPNAVGVDCERPLLLPHRRLGGERNGQLPLFSRRDDAGVGHSISTSGAGRLDRADDERGITPILDGEGQNDRSPDLNFTEVDLCEGNVDLGGRLDESRQGEIQDREKPWNPASLVKTS